MPTTRQYPQEILNWALLSVGMGAVEGAAIAALVKARYTGAAPPLAIDIAIALVMGANAYSNLASFLFAAHQLGRDKIRLTVLWQAIAMFAVLLLALTPDNATGLVLVVLLTIVARVAWVGVITLRAVVWRNNFPSTARARLASKLAALNAIVMATMAFAIGWLLEHRPGALPWLFASAGLIGIVGAWRYLVIRLRGHGLLRERERALKSDGDLKPSVAAFRRVLAADPIYRDYMRSMFVFGSGNLMLPALVLLVAAEKLALPVLWQVALISTVPLLMLPFAVGPWAKFFDRVHIVEFRVVHAWSFVATSAVFFLAAMLSNVWLLGLGSLLLGAGYAGGQLGWNLGHNDFSRPEQAALYMGVHTTLTGVRGLLAPVAGVLLYRVLEVAHHGSGFFALLLPLALNLIGAFSFLAMQRARGQA